MILKQYYLGCLAQASYLIGDEETGMAAVVDPRRDVGEFLDDACELGLTIRHVFLTHFHADFVAGHLELRSRTGAMIHMGSRADAEFAFEPMGDGEAIRLGRIRLVVRETPGHTPESICILVYDDAGTGPQPHAVLTGDTLFIGDVGRPDLMAAAGIAPDDMAGDLYDSLRSKLLHLPDETLVYPAHGAGSMCGRNLSSATVSTIGEQRRGNYALQPMSKDTFVRLVTADQPEPPAYFAHDAVMNREERDTLDEILSRLLQPRTIEEVLRLRREGAVILDARHHDAYAAKHLDGSINIALAGSYAVWAGTLLSREHEIVLVAEPGDEREAALRLGRVGLDRIAGYLDGGAGAMLRGGEQEVRSVARWSAVELKERLTRGDAPALVDVRTEGEWNSGRIPGSVHVPLNRLLQNLDAIPRDGPVLTYCKSGYRSSIAASILRCHGFGGASDLAGGIDVWPGSR